MNCLICGNRGFVAAAPLSTGSSYVGQGKGFHRKALWNHAVTVPCFACAQALETVKT